MRVGRCKPLDIIAGDASNIEEIAKSWSRFSSRIPNRGLYDNLFSKILLGYHALVRIAPQVLQKTITAYQRDLGRVVSYLEDLIGKIVSAVIERAFVCPPIYLYKM